MPPKRKNPQIVRSGNSGNSSRSATPATKPIAPPSGDTGAAGPSVSAPKPQLFPPGSKTPLALLNERCQKQSWEKPLVDARRHAKGFTAAVTLRKRDQKEMSKMHEVRLEPYPWLTCESALEARHWGATYALHRFCNNLPLHRILPPGPRDFWLSLETQRKATLAAEEHRKWEYADDPFAAKDEVETRQKERQTRLEREAKAGERDDQGIGPSEGGSGPKLSKGWQRAPEVRMSAVHRDSVEAIIRRHLSLLSTAAAGDATALSSIDSGLPDEGLSKAETDDLATSLARLGFRKGHIASAVSFVSSLRSPHRSSATRSPAASLRSSFSALGDFDAAIQYLVLVVPEDDLPVRFRPTAASSSFVTSASSFNEEGALKALWAIDRLVKGQGFPRKTVEELWRTEPDGRDEEVARELLMRQLAGWRDDSRYGFRGMSAQVTFAADSANLDALRARDERRRAELEALEALLGPDRLATVVSDDESTTTLRFSIPSARSTKDQLFLDVHLHPRSLYPSPAALLTCSDDPEAGIPILPSLSISSPTLPAYLRLTILKYILDACRDPTTGWEGIIEQGEGGLVYEVLQRLESVWDGIVEDPPDIAEVMKGFLPRSEPPTGTSTPDLRQSSAKWAPATARRKRAVPIRKDPAADSRLLLQQQRWLADPKHTHMLDSRRSLPAWATQDDFLASLASSPARVVVVSGETGSGKTTQLPQFLLDHEIKDGRGSECQIIVTQPRRVSAIGVATRVAQERGTEVDRGDGVVGYAVRGERRAGPNTRLLFVTTGVLLRHLATSDPDLESISHVFVDEVHERSVDSDLLLLELRHLLRRNSKIRIILMSATANEALFSAYFGGAECIHVSGRTHPVQDLYAEDFIHQISYEPSSSTRFPIKPAPGNKDKADRLREAFSGLQLDDRRLRVLEGLSKGGRTDEALIGSIVRHIVQDVLTDDLEGPGAVLVFMSGVAEIRAACDAIVAACGGQVVCLPLHSQLSGAEQRRVFEPLGRRGKVKVVVATNIAETSITIPDVVYVVDSGREKQTIFDPDLGLTRLAEVNCSKAAAKQRRGRAGRTRPGVCFKVFTRARERNDMPNETEPEILRTPLETLFLQVKAIRADEDVNGYLSQALSPPSQAAMDQAIEALLTVGAIAEGTLSLTALGKHLALLPLDLRLGKLLIYGAVFGVFESTLTLAAILSAGKPLFFSPMDKRDEANAARARLRAGNSDLMTNVNAFTTFTQVKAKEGNRAARDFCEDNFISPSTLREVASLRSELVSHMIERGFLPWSYRSDGAASPVNQSDTNVSIVTGIFLAGLSQLVRVERPSAKFERIAGGTVEKDPEAKSVKLFDPQIGRVFLHPGSVLFDKANNLKDGFLAYFSRSATGVANSKVYLRDATEVSLFAVLLFYGGSRRIDLQPSGLSLGPPDAPVRVRAPLRIGTLCNSLRQLLDAVLDTCVDDPSRLSRLGEGGDAEGADIIKAVCQLLDHDGATRITAGI